MDILSDVNLVGNLTVSKNVKARELCATWGKFSNYVDFNNWINIGNESCISKDQAHFSVPVTFYNKVYLERYGFNASFNSLQNKIINEISIDVPSGCKRFVIHSYNLGSAGDATSQTPDLIHPVVSAWCGVNKVEMDLELCWTNVNNNPTELTEFIIGNVVNCSSDRKLNITII